MKINRETAMLMDIQYIREDKKNNKNDHLYVIWKDTKTNEKYLNVVEEPKMDIYFTKPEYRDHSYNKSYAHMNEVSKVTTKFKDIHKVIAEDIGPQGRVYLENAYKSGDRFTKLKELLLYPYVYGADYDIVSWYRIQWLLKMNNDVPKNITKGFLDIEVDGYEVSGMPIAKTCPINAVSLVDGSTKTVYQFIYMFRPYIPKDRTNMTRAQMKKEDEREKDYQMMHEAQQEILDNPEEFINELHANFDDTYNIKDYKLFFYTDEKKMLVHLFQLINTLKLDFIDIWNMSFDIPYIMDRMKALGLDPTTVMCHPDFPIKECYFKADTVNFAIKNKADAFILSSYTVFRDQMQLYASIRKGSSELRSYRLNYIADVELGDRKVEFAEQTDFKYLAYRFFRDFLRYNIKDTLLQYGIENRTDDLGSHYATSYMNATAYTKTHMPTVRLRNRQYMSYIRQNIVPGENINVMNAYIQKDNDSDDETSFEGALVADPIYNDYVGMELYGVKTNNIYSDSMDFDMGAFYPNCIFGMNIEPSTLIFHAILNSHQFKKGYMVMNGITEDYIIGNEDISKECMDNFQTGDFVSFGHKWLNLPSVEELCLAYEEKILGGVMRNAG